VELSAAIAEAVAKFHHMSTQRMANANAADAPTEPLFHYTSEAALFSIVGSETFWFTSIYHMDDPKELTYAFGVAQTVLREAAESGDVLTKMFCEELTDVKDIEKIKAIFGFYSVSFGVRNDPKQWEDYADKSRGVSFGLSPDFFTIFAKDNPSPDEMTFLGKVVYGDKYARARHRAPIDSAIATIQSAHQAGSIKNGKDARIFFQHMAAEMTVETLWNSVTTKETKWRHQNETRLLALNYLKDPQLKIHNAAIKPHVELPQPLLKKCLAEIMIGPKADAGAEARMRAFLDSHNLAHVPITRALMPKLVTYYDHRCHQILPIACGRSTT